MFEARLLNGSILKKIMTATKDLVSEANFDCSSTGIALQAMDSAHVSLVTLFLRKEGFEHYRADRAIPLGINLGSMAKILQCAGNDDIITLKAEDSGDNVVFMFESPKQTRISHFSLKLMDIDSEHLGIPDTQYQCIVKMPSTEFKRIVSEVSIIGDTVTISATKEGVTFSVNGDLGTGSIICKQNPAVDDDVDATVIKLEEDVSLTFALSYLSQFAKATSLCGSVTLSMAAEVPLVVEYKISDDDTEMGHIRYYLAPKIEEDDDDDDDEAVKEEEE